MEQSTPSSPEGVMGSARDASGALRGGGRKTPVARGAGSGGSARLPSARLGWFQRLKESVWAPIAVKALGIVAGMLALAGVGASSLARGAGVPVAVGSGAPGAAMAAGLGILGKVEPARGAGAKPAAAPASAGPPATPPGGSSASSAPGDAGAPPSGNVTADGKVILNRAGVEELCLLPGVGPKRAQAIIDLRTKLGGRFKRMGDLLRLKGIGQKGLKKIEAKAVLDAP